MMDDSRSKNFNSIIASLICELLYEGDNVALVKEKCFQHITENLKINLDVELFSSILEKNKDFVLTPEAESITIKLTPEKYADINKKIEQFSLEHYISKFVDKKKYSTPIKEAIERLIYQSIYENINSFSIGNIKTILPENAKTKNSKEEIEAFNAFLDQPDRDKDAALFSVFLKAVEFAIITSGKGVKQFTRDIFLGKEYCLDSNIIFRMLGVNGPERQESIINLMLSCIHQGIKFQYAVETFKEVKRKIEASIRDIKQGAQSNSIDILQDMIEEDLIQINNSFITHYALCRSQGSIKSAEQYEYLLLSEFRNLERKFNLKSVSTNFKDRQVTLLQDMLYEKKKELNGYRYTKTAAKVDAHNILLVQELRGPNNFNYSDIKSFYLTTDRTLNTILATVNQEHIAETILPSQLYILHNALADSDDTEDMDYQAFNKFLKRRTTNFKYEGRDVLNFIDEIRSITSDTYTIKDVIKSYSDKKYEKGFQDLDSEPELKTFREFAETYLDKKLGKAKAGDQKYQRSLSSAIAELPTLLAKSKKQIRNLDITVTVLLLPLSALLLKLITDKIWILVLGISLIEILKFVISSKTNILSQLAKRVFLAGVTSSPYYKTFSEDAEEYLDAANELIKEDINVYK
jgi:hypothetical protein